MRKLIIAGAVAALAAPASALAASPTVNGWTFKDNTTYDQSNLVGRYSAQITHNGWWVSGNEHQSMGIDQTTDPGSRADGVQSLLGN